jgi:hypothetical protein
MSNGADAAHLLDVLEVGRLQEGADARERGLVAAGERGDGPVLDGVRGLETEVDGPLDRLAVPVVRDLGQLVEVRGPDEGRVLVLVSHLRLLQDRLDASEPSDRSRALQLLHGPPVAVRVLEEQEA